MSPISISSTLNLRTILFYLGSLIGILLFIAYVLFQARFMLEGPRITLTNEPSTFQTERSVLIEGNASNIVHMTLNGRQIYTDTSGYFKEALVLENGYTIATLHAEDRYGRSKNLTRAFVYVRSDTEPAE